MVQTIGCAVRIRFRSRQWERFTFRFEPNESVFFGFFASEQKPEYTRNEMKQKLTEISEAKNPLTLPSLGAPVSLPIFFGTKRNAKFSHFPPCRTKTNKFNFINLHKILFRIEAKCEMRNAHIFPVSNEYE